jgi:hypothetical protein
VTPNPKIWLKSKKPYGQLGHSPKPGGPPWAPGLVNIIHLYPLSPPLPLYWILQGSLGINFRTLLVVQSGCHGRPSPLLHCLCLTYAAHRVALHCPENWHLIDHCLFLILSLSCGISNQAHMAWGIQWGSKTAVGQPPCRGSSPK